MALAEAIREALRARGLDRRELMRRMPPDSGRWAVYRLLSGRSVDPRLSTVVALCEALEVSPTELVQLAGLSERRARGDTARDVRLREAFRSAQELEDGVQETAIQLIEATIAVLRQTGPSGPSS